MSEPVLLGKRQQAVTVILAKGATWEVALRPVAFPANTTVTLTMDGREFPATVSADTVSWRIEAADADSIRAGASVEIHCTFVDGGATTTVAWMKGTVQRD